MTLILTDIVRLFLTHKEIHCFETMNHLLTFNIMLLQLGKHFNFHEIFNFNDLILCSIFTLLKTNAEQ